MFTFSKALHSISQQAGSGPIADVGDVLTNCLEKFGSPDFIMEPEIFSQLKKYFQAGGNPEQVSNMDVLATTQVIAMFGAGD